MEKEILDGHQLYPSLFATLSPSLIDNNELFFLGQVDIHVTI